MSASSSFIAVTSIFLLSATAGKALGDVDCLNIELKAIINTASGSNCEILKDLEQIIDIYENKTPLLCVVTTNQCVDGQLYRNESAYNYEGTINKTIYGNLTVFSYRFNSGETTQAENGSTIRYEFIDGENHPIISNIAVIRITGPPTPPTDIMVDVGCQKANISWIPSLIKAECYVVTIKCGETFVVQNATVCTNSYELYHNLSLQKQCMVSVYAVNPAGSSAIKNITIKIAKDPDYRVLDFGVKITNETSAIFYFSITVNKDCPFSHPIKWRNGDGRCVTNDIGDYNEIPVPLHKHLTVEVCTLTKCTNWPRPISTYHVQKADVTCDSNHGMCYLVCNFAEGHQIKGCVFVFTKRFTNKELPPVFVNNTKNTSCSLNPGAYNVTVYDWKGNDRWKDLGPAVTQQITVERNTIEDNTEDDKKRYIAFVVIPVAALVIIGIVILYMYIKHKRQGHGTVNGDPENLPNNLDPVRRDSFELNIMGGTTGSTDDSDNTFEATTVTNGVEQLTATTDFSKDPESSTPPLTSTPPSVPEPTVEEENTDTSVCGSDKPLLSKRDPPPKRQKESGGSKLLVEMTYPESQPSRFANTSQQETGKSIKTGDPIVTPEANDEPAAIFDQQGIKLKQFKNEGKEFSLAISSEAQLSGDKDQVVVS